MGKNTRKRKGGSGGRSYRPSKKARLSRPQVIKSNGGKLNNMRARASPSITAYRPTLRYAITMCKDK